MLDQRPYTFDRVFRLLLTVGGLVAVIWLMAYLSDVLVPFAVAFLLAYLLNPLVNKVQTRISNRVAAVSITLLTVLAGLIIVLLLLLPSIRSEAKRMGDLAGKLVENSEFVEKVKSYVPEELLDELRAHVSREEIIRLLKEEKFLAVAGTAGRRILPGIWGILAGTASFVVGLLGLIVIALYLIFMLLDFETVKNEWEELIPETYRKPIFQFLQQFDLAMSRHFRAQAVVALLVGILFAIGFWLIGLPLSILLGLFIGLLNMVPYLQLAGLIPASLLALAKAVETGQSVWLVLGLTALVFIVVQLLQDAVLVPKIMGDVTGLSPAMILLSISVWGKLLGFLGLVIALPMTCLTLAYYRELMQSMKAEAGPGQDRGANPGPAPAGGPSTSGAE